MDRYINNPTNEKHLTEMIDGKPMQKTEVDISQPIIVVPQAMMDRFNIEPNEPNT